MHKKLFVCVVCLLASAAAAGGQFQPLNIKPGLWEVHENYSATGLPAGMPAAARAITYKNCITTKDVATNPFSDPDQNCTWTVLNSSGSDMEVKGTSCALGREQGMQSNVHMKLHVVDAEHVNGSGEWTASGNGAAMSGNATGSGKWISANCAGQ